MTLLQDHRRRAKSTEEAYRAYATDVEARHARRLPNSWGIKKEVTCHWLIEYESGADTTVTLLMLPLLFLGHFHYKRSQLKFITFHYLTPSEARRLRRGRFLRQLLLPIVVLGMLSVGIILFIELCAVVVTLFHAPEPNSPSKLAVLGISAAALILTSLIMFSMLKAQRWLWKLAEPPGTDDFRDQRILLRSVKIA